MKSMESQTADSVLDLIESKQDQMSLEEFENQNEGCIQIAMSYEDLLKQFYYSDSAKVLQMADEKQILQKLAVVVSAFHEL